MVQQRNMPQKQPPRLKRREIPTVFNCSIFNSTHQTIGPWVHLYYTDNRWSAMQQSIERSRDIQLLILLQNDENVKHSNIPEGRIPVKFPGIGHCVLFSIPSTRPISSDSRPIVIADVINSLSSVARDVTTPMSLRSPRKRSN
jgi:hypothetical protein